MNTFTSLATAYTSTTGASVQMTDADFKVFMAVIGAMLFFSVIIIVLTYVISSWFLSRIFQKAGIKAWVGWVPFYNMWKLLEMGGQQGFWAVLSIVPIVNYVAAVFTYIAMYEVGKSFGKSGGWVVMAIFLPIVWLGVFAFNDAKWKGPKIEPRA